MGLAALLEWIGRNTVREEPDQERDLIRAEQTLSQYDLLLAREQERRERQRRDGERRAE